MEYQRDIFISYKHDDESEHMARKLTGDLEAAGYSVYFNPNEIRSGNFNDRLLGTICGCRDLLLIVSSKCLEQLLRHEKEDWIRTELLAAESQGKTIIPVMLRGVEFPEEEAFPSDLRFLRMKQAVDLPRDYMRMPFPELIKMLSSKPERGDIYRDVYNSNKEYNVTDDFKLLKQEAESGDYEAMYQLANMYFYGMADEQGGSSRDFGKAYEWFKRISDADNEFSYLADSMIAKMHYRGVVPCSMQSYEKALEYHKKAAYKSGYSAQQLAYMLSTGSGCEYNFEIAEGQYLASIEHGDSIAYNELAKMYIRLGKFESAERVYQVICNDFPDASYQLGCLYKSGVLNDPPCPDYDKAFHYFLNAINQCEVDGGRCKPEAYFEVGTMFFNPTGRFKKNFKRAQEYFLKAADMGHVSAQYMVGYMYEHGHVERNIQKAIEYHKRAADGGHALSPTHLAILYQMEECKNYHQAFKYAQIAADLDEKEGQFVLGNLLYMGRGCEPNVNKAYEMYSKAYQHGVDQAGFMLKKIEGNKGS